MSQGLSNGINSLSKSVDILEEALIPSYLWDEKREIISRHGIGHKADITHKPTIITLKNSLQWFGWLLCFI